MQNERELALGKREALKAEFKRTMLRAGIYLEELHDITNPIIGEDLLNIDLVKAKVLVDDLFLLQRKAKAGLEKIRTIEDNYGLEAEFD